MFARALIAFLVLPGMVAFIIPAAWLRFTDRLQLDQPLGLIILAIGIVGLFWCVRDFYVSGKGTLAPWAPPQRLVTVGLYRYSRNPMYVSVVLVLLMAVSFGSPALYTTRFSSSRLFIFAWCTARSRWLARTALTGNATPVRFLVGYGDLWIVPCSCVGTYLRTLLSISVDMLALMICIKTPAMSGPKLEITMWKLLQKSQKSHHRHSGDDDSRVYFGIIFEPQF